MAQIPKRSKRSATKEECDKIKEAIKDNDVSTIQQLLDSDINANVVLFADHETPLHYACRHGLIDIVKILLQEGADVNAVNSFHETPLQRAVRGSHTDVVQLLIDKGADINAKDRENDTPLETVLKSALEEYIDTDSDVVKELLNNKAKVDVNDGDHVTLMHGAALCGSTNVINMMLEEGVDVNIQDEVEMTEGMEVSQLVESSSATVHGVFVGAVSPVKSSRKNSAVKYFESQLCDGKKTVRVVSFEPKFRNEIEEAKKGQYGVALRNCCVKRGRAENDDYEIIAGSKSSILKSPKKFKIGDAHTSGLNCVDLGTLEEIKDCSENQYVTIVGKVVSIESPEVVKVKDNGKELHKQEFVIADCTATCRGVLWEQHLGALKTDHCYKLIQVTVRSFNGSKYFSLGQKCVIKGVEDIGEVVEDNVDVGCGGTVVVKAEIVTVVGIDGYRSCRNCNSKVSVINDFMGECNKCNAKTKLLKCKEKNVAKVVLEDVNGKEYKLSIFNEVLQHVIEHGRTVAGNASTAELLLSAPQLTYTITSKDTVSSVTI